ncbi:Helix-turn-helix domain-containing protein [Bacillus sp. 491mf]|uniref:helix-turn-helix domain-containing protein n=1 Tax=Bacillus TaxID=1386 RepID=UPI000550DDF0|nr:MULTISPECIES: helix-turn-helix domain-containing protein [unclassified Bacillus (in: firmicutes)]SFD22176.1 Helix-turn-helix domain-containing protein [Bacillus sp. 491mf]
MHAEKLGDEIKKIRRMRGLTQKHLADNICHQSEISRIESGVVYPSMDILQGIAAKLKVPIIHFYEVVAYSDIERKKQFKDLIQSLCKQKKYEEIYKKTWDELKKEEDHPEFQQFLLWHHHLSAYMLKKVNYEYCILELKKLITQQSVGMDVFQSLYIENSIANIYAENECIQKSIEVYKHILKQLKSLHSNEEFAIKVGYNYAKALYLDDRYEEALYNVEKTIETSCQNSNMTLIGQLFYQKGECLEKLGHSEDEIRIAYAKALFFFELLDLHSYKNTLLNKMKI